MLFKESHSGLEFSTNLSLTAIISLSNYLILIEIMQFQFHYLTVDPKRGLGPCNKLVE